LAAPICAFPLNIHLSLAIIKESFNGEPSIRGDTSRRQGKIMLDKKERNRKPRTVNEAAELLLSDLLVQHLQALSRMSEKEFSMLCDHVTPYLIDEFQIWQGNNDLIESCYRQSKVESEDPARIILNRVKDLLNNFSGYLVIT
jgi:hypothetical protein